MRKLGHIIGSILITALLVAGCSVSDPSTTPTPAAPQPTVQPTQAAQVSSTDQFLQAANSSGLAYDNTESDETLLQIGNGVCDLYSQGYTTDEVINTLADLAVQVGITDPDQAKYIGWIAGVGVKYLCPQYLPQFNS
jgi:hypothetical protein